MRKQWGILWSPDDCGRTVREIQSNTAQHNIQLKQQLRGSFGWSSLDKPFWNGFLHIKTMNTEEETATMFFSLLVFVTFDMLVHLTGWNTKTDLIGFRLIKTTNWNSNLYWVGIWPNESNEFEQFHDKYGITNKVNSSDAWVTAVKDFEINNNFNFPGNDVLYWKSLAPLSIVFLFNYERGQLEDHV